MTDFLEDPLWYKDAVIYELHVRSFFDATNDGYGDFQGLREKLPYLESLGVNTLWLLPFLESPLKDDGYDIADYYNILPVHGDLDDFKAFLDEAHDRGMRVITELVLNHTSDQHPWFQEARDPSSDKHDWYVWSATSEKYSMTRVIFTDTEISNWSWDRKAQKYYWHRFFSHQPDLNYDNPDVREAMKQAMFHWLDLGVDGLRLDAVPYLYEREGTNCENLPETIEFIKHLRGAIEERYGSGKILLAEANQWPEDTLPYFGDGDGVQMAFNFPVMPRMFMALRRETRRPFVEMLELTRDIPDEAQWAIFLRNHDELTLEMVTDEERDYMYNEYANDPRFRINVGIRRRLATLLGGNRRAIELMNALLLSLKGSPILYYGDEIGMGDDPFLGDRDGVRTPMQWSSDKNGGFSRAPHHRLFMPPINRGAYSYEFVNVEDAENDPHSLFHFMKRLLALRKQHARVFGRGSLELLNVENQSILAFRREYEGDSILVVANLSRFAQSFFLPNDEDAAGDVPVEMFSQTAFPPFDEDPYHLVLGPHGFYWFNLKPEEEMQREAERHTEMQLAELGSDGHLPVIRVKEGLENLLVPTLAHGRGRENLEKLLPEYIQKQRWFGAKSESIEGIEISDAVRLRASPYPVYLSILKVSFESRAELYVLPLVAAYEQKNIDRVIEERPQAALAWLDAPSGRALLHDAAVMPDFWCTLFDWWQRGSRGRSIKGLYVAQGSACPPGIDSANVHLLTGEQSNSSAIIDDTLFIKLYRRLERGVNPETELLTHLTDVDFTFTPRLHGTIDFKRGWNKYALGVFQEALPVENDGWGYALEMTGRFLDRVAETKLPEEIDRKAEETVDVVPEQRKSEDANPVQDDPIPVWLEEVASEMLSLVRVLGIRTAELHQALAKAADSNLGSIPTGASATRELVDNVRAEVEQTRELLEDPDAADGFELPAADVWAAVSDELKGVRALEAGTAAPEGRPDNGPHMTRADTAAPTSGGGTSDAGTSPAPSSNGTQDGDEIENPLAFNRIRIHGDYHLGQILRSDGEVYILDFEGEPARSLEERRRPDNALRDVAGMMRSIEYGILAAWDKHTERDPDLEPWVRVLIEWCESIFLDAYYDTAGDADFLVAEEPRSALLRTFLIQKVCYEIRYELGHRPSWVWLPLYGLERLMIGEPVHNRAGRAAPRKTPSDTSSKSY